MIDATPRPMLVTFYGDDFTGSTDALEALEIGGVPSVLFLQTPTADLLARFPDARAVGVAGLSRSMAAHEMVDALTEAFTALAEVGAPLCHYKVCSTFDSSPSIGSIGLAIDIGIDVFDPAFVPVVVGAPRLGRFVAFGNLFARGDGAHHRLDRHPTMRRHPVTPMDEADLRRHLAAQTSQPIGLVDLATLDAGPDALVDELDTLAIAGNRVVVFDTTSDPHLAAIGRILAAASAPPGFVVGSSGVEDALTAAWRAGGLLEQSGRALNAVPVEQIIVMSGSASSTTSAQLTWAEEHGFVGIRIDPAGLIDNADHGEQHRVHRAALDAWANGSSVLFYSARGPDDPALVRQVVGGQAEVDRRLGRAMGQVVHRAVVATGCRRICVAGGDTCGYVMTELGVHALTIRARLDPAGPLCTAHAADPRLNGLEVSLKGGQVGTPEYFGKVRLGSIDSMAA